MRKIIVTQRFEKDFKKLQEIIKNKTEVVVQLLKKDSRTKAVDLKKLKGFKKFWRVKVDRNYRLIYTITPDAIELRRIKHRQGIYKSSF
ncbi:type II toxin-antitoxin system mRNA interferase toxin, RelE/StbE family [Patescibacteria group bacterium]|nr:type II toxin-antitoxin system mRNA interferase toxin, RelE/StbE family [Patescibacteria group bacterium]MBU2416115.1 type II toxin-antitoxin system mRNA interferase toxin, RelE/StbE family [Patescibacteria group bacterium]